MKFGFFTFFFFLSFFNFVDSKFNFDFDPTEFSKNDHFLFRTIKKRRLDTINENEKVPGIVVKLTEKVGNLFLSKKSYETMEKKLEGKVLDTIKFKALQMNVTVFEPELVKLEMPEIRFENKEPYSFVISSKDGQARFKGLYKGVYRTIRDGYSYADLTGLNLVAELKFVRLDKNSIATKVKSCKFSTDSTVVEMKPNLFSQADQMFSELIEKSIEEKLCGGVDNLANVIGKMIMESINNGPVELESFNDSSFNTEFVSEPEATKSGLLLSLDGQFSDSLPVDLERTKVHIHQSDSDYMVYSYISDFVFNSYLSQFKEKEIDLEIPPEFSEFLRTSCSSSSCLGTFLPFLPESYPDSYGKITVAFKNPPSVEFLENGSKMIFGLSLKLFVQEKLIGSVDFFIDSFIEKFEINADMDSEENDVGENYKLKAKITVNNIDVISTFMEDKRGVEFAENLENLMGNNKEIIQKVIEFNLHRLFPLKTNSHLEVESIQGFFRKHTLVFAFDLPSEDKKLLRHLRFF
ncbi:hypothetical protein FO519_005209 [Halicephalobus sp. NKZ332]|nr:hypothetical protein FO519_005209 [Halicephalobus sp. NKZ332]